MNLVSHIETLRRMAAEARQEMNHAVAMQRAQTATTMAEYLDSLDETIAIAAKALDK